MSIYSKSEHKDSPVSLHHKEMKYLSPPPIWWVNFSCFKKDDQCQMAKQQTEEQAWDWAGHCRTPPDLNKTGPFLLYSLRHSSSIAPCNLPSTPIFSPLDSECLAYVHVCVQSCAIGCVPLVVCVCVCAAVYHWLHAHVCMHACELEVMIKMLSEEL